MRFCFVLRARAGRHEAKYHAYLSDNSLDGNPGIATGQLAAACLLELRSGDGSFPVPPPTFFGGTEPGEWRSTTTPATSMATPWLGDVTPFALKSVEQLSVPAPPHLKSGAYRKDYDEVKAVGSTFSTKRTPEQTELSYFYSDNFLALWERTLRTIAMEHVDGIGDRARLFALAHMAAGDAAIGAWRAKKYWNLWRPITAIREGDNDGNPKTAGDMTWEPLNVTPNYPDYTSGANNLTSSIVHILRHFFRTDRMTFTMESKFALVMNPIRTYHRFSDVARDVIDVRVYQGIHFRFADEVAFLTGRYSANWVFEHELRPVN